MLGFEDYRKIIADSLFDKGIISERLYEKCSRPKYITALPGDLRSTDATLLSERMDVIEEEISRREEIADRANYRIGVKLRDSERLGKRVEKSISNMDKSVENINNESDKIVKDITALETKLDKVDFSDNKTLKDSIDSRIKSFKEKHNDLFGDDLTGSNVAEYGNKVSELNSASVNLNNILKEALDLKLVNKSDVNKSDISKNISRIEKNIDKFVTEGQKITTDVKGISDNQGDIDYISQQLDTVIKEIEVLEDEFVATHNKFMEHSGGPDRRSPPNPRAIVNDGAKPGDSFTFLPRNYDKYMVD